VCVLMEATQALTGESQSFSASKRARRARARAKGARRQKLSYGKSVASRFRYSQTVPSRLPGFPSNKIVQMRYVEGLAVTASTAANIFRQVFNISSIYDPYVTGSGHQPLGHDQWSAFYNHYVVLGAKVSATTCPKDHSANGDPIALAIKIDDDGTTGTTNYSIPQLIERGASGQYAVSSGVLAASHPMSTTAFYSTKKFFNVADVKDNLARLGAAFGASPADSAFAVVCVGTLNAELFSTATPFSLVVTIDYIVELSEPKDLAES